MTIVTIIKHELYKAVFEHMAKLQGLKVVDTYTWFDGDKRGITSVIQQ